MALMDRHEGKIPVDEIGRLVGRCDPLILEIGAHDGQDTEVLCQAFPAAKIHCFEPYCGPAERWRQRIWDREQPYNARLQECAVGAVDGMVPFYPSTGQVGDLQDWDRSGSIRRPTGHLVRSQEIQFKDPIMVPCCRLDTWAPMTLGLVPVDFIWCDVQGAQRDLIEGAQQTLGVTRWLYIECHEDPLYDGEPSQKQLCELLPGFRLVANYDTDNLLFKALSEVEQ